MEAIIAYSLFVYFWYHLLGKSDILARPRARVIALVGPHLSYPLSCGFCFTFWSGLALLVSPVYVPVGALAMLFVAPVLNLVLDLVVRKMRQDAEPPVLPNAWERSERNRQIIAIFERWANHDETRKSIVEQALKDHQSGWKS